MIYAKALLIAETLQARFLADCERVEIAGSLRRRRPDVHDIDLVICPRTTVERDCFDNPIGVRSLFHPEVMELGEFKKNGPREKQILLAEGIYLDLWIVLPPAQWGWIYALRTGPGDYTHWLVTPKRFGGGLPGHLELRHGALWNHGTLVPTPEEEDFFKALDVPFVKPELRCASVRTPAH